jgi:hypothetical protein
MNHYPWQPDEIGQDGDHVPGMVAVPLLLACIAALVAVLLVI